MLHRWLLILALLGGLGATVAAQGEGPRAFADSATIERRVADLTERLSLRADQRASVRTVLFEEAALARRAMQEADGDRAAMRRAFRDRAQESDRRIEDLLSEGQKETYRHYREERRREMRQRYQESERPRP